MPRSVPVIIALSVVGLIAATVCGSAYWQAWMIVAGMGGALVAGLLSL